MNKKAKGALAALVSSVAAATGASTAVAAEQVPVSVPLSGVEHALHMEAPKLSTGVPLPLPGAPEGPRYVEGQLLPDGILPQVPLSTELPKTELTSPVPQLLPNEKVDRLGLSTPGSGVEASTPGASVNPPLTGPLANRFGLPDVTLPQAALETPMLQSEPGADLGLN
ncbi:hypothetical protein [Streptomyces apocyni]|uniref:hypothetical protein n=1 Tax=Streptomyces apocyni TaxID=2654677 RepID=UPI0012E9A5C4|nr:hypothetical protein [Streptomyces apocyni]